MKIYFAPLEGVTDVIYRRVHRACFSGIDKYFLPFISPTQHCTFTPKEKAALSPADNAGQNAIPQVLAKNSDYFLWMANEVRDLGYPEINLNLGCPSATVTAKGKGSGMLRDLEALERFLDDIFARSPLPVSIKTRIGYESPDEWPALIELLSRYPMHELIVHPRTRKEFYSGTPHRELCADVFKATDAPFVYNGDLFSAEDCRTLPEYLDGTSAIMLGRGLIANPMLAQELAGGEKLSRAALRNFHDRLFEAYMEKWPATAVVGRMHEIMKFIACCFEDPHKPLKVLRKATTPAVYNSAVNMLFDGHALLENPCYRPLKL